MKKEEFLSRYKNLTESIRELEASKVRLRNEFIEANRLFQDGDKVVVTYNRGQKKVKEVLFIEKAVVETYFGEVCYKFLKCKRDGNASKHHAYIYKFLDIELYNEEKHG